MDTNDLDFPSLYADFYPRIMRYLRRLVGESEAEDLAQETFIKASQGLEGFRGEAQVSTWLYRIATNLAIDRLRSPSYQRLVMLQLPRGWLAGSGDRAGRWQSVDRGKSA